MGMTFLPTLLKETEGAWQRSTYFDEGPGARIFRDQLHWELARRASLSERLHLGRTIADRLVKQVQGGSTP